MSLLNQKNKKDKKGTAGKNSGKTGTTSKFIQKSQTSTGFASKQQNTGSQRGS